MQTGTYLSTIGLQCSYVAPLRHSTSADSFAGFAATAALDWLYFSATAIFLHHFRACFPALSRPNKSGAYETTGLWVEDDHTTRYVMFGELSGLSLGLALSIYADLHLMIAHRLLAFRARHYASVGHVQAPSTDMWCNIAINRPTLQIQARVQSRPVPRQQPRHFRPTQTTKARITQAFQQSQELCNHNFPRRS